MAKTVGNYQIPFNKNGSQLHYPDHAVVWRDNLPFVDTLTYEGFSRGRSAAYFHFKRQDGSNVCMFMKEMEEIIPDMVKGVVSGTFQFVKRGKNYGCTKVADLPPATAS